MTRAARFSQADATRALRAAVNAGMKPAECIIDSSGTIRLIFSDGVAGTPTNPLDRLLPQ